MRQRRMGKQAQDAPVRQPGSSPETRRPRRVAFIHPNLGIGGAEQLVVLAAVGLQQRPGYDVEIFTAHHDPQHCFEETINGELKVTQYGDWLPERLFGVAVAFCAILRMFWVFLRLYVRSLRYGQEFDVLIVDQIPAINPLYRRLCSKLLFYCHYPDLLLCQERQTTIKRWYRLIVDALEDRTIKMCDGLLVNSQFTASVAQDTFPELRSYHLHVLYPPVDLKRIETQRCLVDSWEKLQHQFPGEVSSLHSKGFVLSLNRYEEKKNIQRALQCMDALRRSQLFSKHTNLPVLVIAGGYDKTLPENKRVYDQLRTLAEDLGFEINKEVVFLRSISDTLRWGLLIHARALLYTPSKEHFGMVPVEAMAAGTPVIACKSGGPLESILDGKTGILCADDDPTCIPDHFAKALTRLLNMEDSELVHSVNETLYRFACRQHTWQRACSEHVKARFGLESFARDLDTIISDVLQ